MSGGRSAVTYSGADTVAPRRADSDDGAFRREESRFRRWVAADGSTDFPVSPGRYHLYVARACPWAHRTMIGRLLMGLEDVIGISFLDPVRDARGWAFTGGGYTDRVNGASFLSEAYTATDPNYDARVSVPVLWDTKQGVIVSNESADTLRMFHTAFRELAAHPIDLYPVPLRIRAHYYLTHPMINPSGLVAVRPAADFLAPHGRAGL